MLFVSPALLSLIAMGIWVLGARGERPAALESTWAPTTTSLAHESHVPPRQTPALALSLPIVLKPNGVSITLRARAYALGTPISATIVNHLAHTIYALDEKSDCSIAILERRNGKSWQPIRGCALRRLPRVVAIASGHNHPVMIDPHSSNFGVIPGTTRPAFGAGTYRIMVTYRFAPDLTAMDLYRAYSKTFSIRPAGASR